MFGAPKYDTMEELDMIRRKSGDKRAYVKNRMLFNYFTDNKDDHCKNFSYHVVGNSDNGAWRWRLAPAYDLTLCTEGYNGEYATSVNGTGHPHIADVIAVGTKIKLTGKRCRNIIDEVRYGCIELLRYEIEK